MVFDKVLHSVVTDKEMSIDWKYSRFIGQQTGKIDENNSSICDRPMPKINHQSKEVKQTCHIQNGDIPHVYEGRRYNLQASKGSNMELWCDTDFFGNWRVETDTMTN